jgi:SAM-dependent methyltransferase
VTGFSRKEEADWAVALFKRSVLKQAKFRQILAFLDDPAGKTGLDIGADNGVISYLLRQRGGQWHSADLDERAVASIRQLVGSNVHQIDGEAMPFKDGAFDQVIVVDFLEHVPDDRGIARELARILKPGGRLIINVPHLKPGSRLNRLRKAIGLTDEWHGHLRPGYTSEGLGEILGPAFVIDEAKTYSRAFSELIDTVLNGLYLKLQRRKGENNGSSKGAVITNADFRRHRKEFLLVSLLYPVIWSIARLDRLLWLQSGYKLIVRARRLGWPSGAGERHG